MKRTKALFILILLLSLIVFSSCELAYNKNYKKGKIWFVGLADFDDEKKTSYSTEFLNKQYSVRSLDYTADDVVEEGKAFKSLAEKTNVEFVGLYFGRVDQAEYKDIHADYKFYGSWENYKKVLEEKLTPSDNDIVIFAFSSHGVGEKYRKLEYGSNDAFDESAIIFYSNDKNTDATCVAVPEIYNFIDENFKGSKFILCDTCYSGSFIVGDGVSVNTDLYDKNPITLFFNRNIKQSSSVYILSACTYKQESTEPDELEHGAFTYYVLKALGWNEENQKIEEIPAADGNMITAGSIASYVYKNGGVYTYRWNEQIPVFSAGSSDLILFSF